MNRTLALGFFSFFIAASTACVGTEERADVSDYGMSEEPASQELELARPPGPGICGCRNGDDRNCREVTRTQWACSYGWPCNYVAYKPDCSYANQCPPTTWNGCPLQSQICQNTGRTCEGTCADGVQCSIVYEPEPIRDTFESSPDDDEEEPAEPQ